MLFLLKLSPFLQYISTEYKRLSIVCAAFCYAIFSQREEWNDLLQDFLNDIDITAEYLQFLDKILSEIGAKSLGNSVGYFVF